jgi:hypothetical protein
MNRDRDPRIFKIRQNEIMNTANMNRNRDKNRNEITNTANINELSSVSTRVIKKYKNDRPGTISMLNAYKKRKSALDKGYDISRVYKFLPNEVNNLTYMGNIQVTQGSSIDRYIRNKRSTKSVNLSSMILGKKIMPTWSYTFLKKSVRSYIPVPPSLDIEEAHKYAKMMLKFIKRDHLDIKIKFVVVTENHGGVIFI